MAELILALDQGTTSSRAILFERSGSVRAVAQQPLDARYPYPGWVVQDADEIWRSTLQVARDVLEKAGVRAGEVAAAGITNQRETTVLWDRKSGEAVGPAIVWQSRQSAPLVRAIEQRGMAGRYQQITGLVPDAYFSATKIAWMLEQEPELRRRAEAGELLFGTVDSWLLWKLSGGKLHITDYSNASRTMLYDVRRLEWSAKLLEDLGIPPALLPEVRGNSELLCETEPELLGVPVRVMGVAGDQQAALFGQTCFAPGEAKNTYGTGSFLLMNTGTEAVASRSRLLTTIAWGIGGEVEYALEGAIFVTGSAVQWLRDGLGIIESSSDVEALAGTVEDSGGVVFVPALTGLGAPHWDPDARGTILGITRGTTRAHVARATLESIALQTRDVVEAMSADSGITLTELRVDGGASANDLLMQIQADVLGVPVVRAGTTETTALGAAYLAGLAAGVWTDRAELAGARVEGGRFEPRLEPSQRDAMYERWRRAVERAAGWAVTQPG